MREIGGDYPRFKCSPLLLKELDRATHFLVSTAPLSIFDFARSSIISYKGFFIFALEMPSEVCTSDRVQWPPRLGRQMNAEWVTRVQGELREVQREMGIALLERIIVQQQDVPESDQRVALQEISFLGQSDPVIVPRGLGVVLPNFRIPHGSVPHDTSNLLLTSAIGALWSCDHAGVTAAPVNHPGHKVHPQLSLQRAPWDLAPSQEELCVNERFQAAKVNDWRRETTSVGEVITSKVVSQRIQQ
eukprot:Protomagalhaensia_sp_Gyna_25__2825@NODE_2638_length_972_cov_13_042872_g2198_i0_p1_GENE_NODE_2638_length_972_cov_13_042872_g2198_i0NODE_2638_length_972_cov_13_042872_g2198_i0_p1_ORF_typecomplete_len287_score37_39_NODE_2638_length_972_cov_13_042872_g2198_i0127861